jgi:hypothetical protein
MSFLSSYKTKDGVTRTPLKTVGELRCFGRVNSSCSNSDTRRVNLVTNPVISHERGKNREVFTTSGTYPWMFEMEIRCTFVIITINIRNRYIFLFLRCFICCCIKRKIFLKVYYFSILKRNPSNIAFYINNWRFFLCFRFVCKVENMWTQVD